VAWTRSSQRLMAPASFSNVPTLLRQRDRKFAGNPACISTPRISFSIPRPFAYAAAFIDWTCCKDATLPGIRALSSPFSSFFWLPDSFCVSSWAFGTQPPILWAVPVPFRLLIDPLCNFLGKRHSPYLWVELHVLGHPRASPLAPTRYRAPSPLIGNTSCAWTSQNPD